MALARYQFVGLEDLRIHLGDYAGEGRALVNFSDCRRLTIIGGTLICPDNTALRLYGCRDIRLVDQTIRGHTGILIKESREVMVAALRYSGKHAFGSKYVYGVNVNGSTGVRVVSSEFEDCRHGVTMGQCEDGRIKGNVVRRADSWALGTHPNSKGVKVEHNRIVDSWAGIAFREGHEDCTEKHNEFENVRTYEVRYF